MNNPVRLTDPLGLYVWDKSLGGSSSDKELNKTKAGKEIVERRNEIRNAMNNAADEAVRATLAGTISSEQAGAIFDALSAYGSEGDDNGVNVRFGKIKDGDASTAWTTDSKGNVTPFETNNETGDVKALVTITFEAGKINARNVVHEGSHTSDRQNLADSLENPALANISAFDRSQNISKYETERRAYQATSYIDQAMSSPSNVWQRGWTEADRRRGIDDHIKNVDKVSPPGTRPGPGGNIYQRAKP